MMKNLGTIEPELNAARAKRTDISKDLDKIKAEIDVIEEVIQSVKGES